MGKVFLHIVFIVCVFVFFCDKIAAQNSTQSTTEKQNNNQVNFSSVDYFKQQFNQHQFTDPDKALNIAKEALAFVIGSGNSFGKLHLESLNFLGIAYLNVNQYDSSLFYFHKTLNLAIELNDSLFISKSYNNLGVINGNTGNISRCIYYFNKSGLIDEKIGDIENALISYLNIGTIYFQIDALDSARYFINKSLDGATQLNDNALIASCYLSLGNVEYDDDNWNEAKKYYFKATEIGSNEKLMDVVAIAYHNLAALYRDKNQNRIAIEYELKSLLYAKQGGLIGDEISAYKGLSKSYAYLGQYKEAYDYQSRFTFLSDSLRKVENRNSLIEMQEKYNAEQTTRENQILIQKNEIKDLEIAKSSKDLANSRIIIFSSVFGLVLLIVLAFTLYNRNLLKQKANLKLVLANKVIQEKNKDITDSIEYASKIQEALLPTKENQKLFDDSFILLLPKDIVSGDFFWYAEVDDKKIIAAVDCTGHGVPGAFMSMIGNTFLQEIVNEKKILQPHQILNELRLKIIKALNQKGDGTNRKDGMDMAICVIDQQKMQLDYAGANNPLYIVQQNNLTEIKGDKQPVGYFEHKMTDFTSHSLSINKGDCIYIFTDGLADQFGGPKGKKFKYKQFKEILMSCYQIGMQEQKKTLLNAFNNWKGDLEQVDDICVIGVRV